MYMCHLTSFYDDIKIHITIILRNKSAINLLGPFMYTFACILIDFYILFHPSHITHHDRKKK